MNLNFDKLTRNFVPCFPWYFLKKDWNYWCRFSNLYIHITKFYNVEIHKFEKIWNSWFWEFLESEKSRKSRNLEIYEIGEFMKLRKFKKSRICLNLENLRISRNSRIWESLESEILRNSRNREFDKSRILIKWEIDKSLIIFYLYDIVQPVFRTLRCITFLSIMYIFLSDERLH